VQFVACVELLGKFSERANFGKAGGIGGSETANERERHALTEVSLDCLALLLLSLQTARS